MHGGESSSGCGGNMRQLVKPSLQSGSKARGIPVLSLVPTFLLLAQSRRPAYAISLLILRVKRPSAVKHLWKHPRRHTEVTPRSFKFQSD